MIYNVLCCPKDTEITASVLSDASREIFLEYETTSGTYTYTYTI